MTLMRHLIFAPLLTALLTQPSVRADAPPAQDVWSYQALAETDPAAEGGTARTVPPGDTDANHAFDWRLYDLPNGRYRVSLRLRADQKPAGGAFNLKVWQLQFGSGIEPVNRIALSIQGADLPVAGYQQVATELTLNATLPYTYYFFHIENGTNTPVKLDRVELRLLEKLPLPPATPALREWKFQGTGSPATAATFNAKFDAPLGRYEAIFRLKKENTAGDALHGVDAAFRLLVGGEGAGGATRGGLDGYFSPLPSSFRQGAVEEFRFPFEVNFPATTITGAVGQPALDGADIKIDAVTFRLIQRSDEMQALSKAKIPAAVPTLIRHEDLRLWLVHGLFEEDLKLRLAAEAAGFHIAEAAFENYHGSYRLAGQLPLRYQAAGMATGELTPGMDAAEAGYEPRLFAYDVAVVQDVPGRILTLQQRMLLNNFVKAGGGLLVVGGMYGLDRGGYQDSELLNEILPANLSAAPSLHKLSDPLPMRAPGNGPLLSGLTWDDKPMVEWLHDVKPKPGSTTQLAAGDSPVLVTWTLGNGRVALLAAPPFGDPGSGVLYTDSQTWPVALQRLLRWLAAK